MSLKLIALLLILPLAFHINLVSWGTFTFIIFVCLAIQNIGTYSKDDWSTYFLWKFFPSVLVITLEVLGHFTIRWLMDLLYPGNAIVSSACSLGYLLSYVLAEDIYEHFIGSSEHMKVKYSTLMFSVFAFYSRYMFKHSFVLNTNISCGYNVVFYYLLCAHLLHEHVAILLGHMFITPLLIEGVVYTVNMYNRPTSVGPELLNFSKWYNNTYGFTLKNLWNNPALLMNFCYSGLGFMVLYYGLRTLLKRTSDQWKFGQRHVTILLFLGFSLGVYVVEHGVFYLINGYVFVNYTWLEIGFGLFLGYFQNLFCNSLNKITMGIWKPSPHKPALKSFNSCMVPILNGFLSPKIKSQCYGFRSLLHVVIIKMIPTIMSYWATVYVGAVWFDQLINQLSSFIL